MSHDKKHSSPILVVDDHPVNRELARIYLNKLGWPTRECDSAEQALRELSEWTPSAILLDIKMPRMDGIQLMRLIRTSQSSALIRLVAYTAHALKDEVQRIREAGFDDVLIKPVTFSHMRNCFGLYQDQTPFLVPTQA